MNELQELLVRLHHLGFQAHISHGPPEQIVGGRSVSEVMGLRLYEKSFNIVRTPRGWEVRMDGDGQMVLEGLVLTAEEVAELVATQEARGH